MKAPTEAFPLTWPPGRPREKYPAASRFRITLGAAINEVRDEVGRLVRQNDWLGEPDLVISSNLPLKRNGEPAASKAYPRDPAVAVYFTYKKKPMCFACDRWDRVEDNMWAIAKTIDALRGISRWGTGEMIEQAFTGFVALPAPVQPWQTLEIGRDATREQITEAHRRLAMKHHPDRGGDPAMMAAINAARDQMLGD